MSSSSTSSTPELPTLSAKEENTGQGGNGCYKSGTDQLGQELG
ncbi:hypothetical protein Cadr_000020667 [Camelus dromedarius]|uniref:Uncharacterized protein n=1 Tax=Camelus dromedarius TaxID=9838 RepID=A0A5N4D0S5_CAMDR|nr:hypothetical protein Cadr_000020667 [Camelus dromedarius]